MRLLDFPCLKSEKGVCYTREHLARMAKAGLFPRPIALSNKQIAWLETEVDDWIAHRIHQRDELLDMRQAMSGRTSNSCVARSEDNDGGSTLDQRDDSFVSKRRK